ncbi:MAG TPA: CoA transferase [Geminicoccaceae bacterium]|jgi:crotonobetainyl-CoA:carnitine CoA-transferase CaiB-like acyl-CoA transferase|nr:CoA transferase [Geminicoccaceae bacterium]HRY23500.1 CoA transferase [Geminicoccaceae bacterium]
MTGALSGLEVLDLSDTIGGQYCTRLMADFGARVRAIEPPGGTATRRIGPFDAHGRSLTHLHLSLGKEETPAADMAELRLRADIVVCGAGEGAAFRATNHKAVVTEVSSFGADGPCAHWQAPEIVLQALSGMMNSNGTAGREPLYGVGNRASYAAGVAAYIATVAALLARRGTGLGDLVRVDSAETAAAMCFPYLQQYFYNGTNRRRGLQDIPAGQVLCRGSWVCIWVYSNRFERLCRALGLEDCLEDPKFADLRERSGNWRGFFERVAAVVRDRDAEDLVAELQGLDIIAARAYRPSELRASRHLAARAYWRRIEIDGARYVIPGPPFRFSATPAIERGVPA